MIKLKWGNHKIPKDTMIFNMSSATNCPSAKLGLCKLEAQKIKCYALKAEITYKDHVINSRNEQEQYWKTRPTNEILDDMRKKISSRRSETTYFRFNESGDFANQGEVNKLSEIADKLKKEFNITTYGFSARSDLDFKDAKFLVKGSGHNKGNNGKTIVVNNENEIPKGFIKCTGSCKVCNICKIKSNTNIAFMRH